MSSPQSAPVAQSLGKYRDPLTGPIPYYVIVCISLIYFKFILYYNVIKKWYTRFHVIIYFKENVSQAGFSSVNFTHVYVILLTFTYVYVILLTFTYVYVILQCFIVFVSS